MCVFSNSGAGSGLGSWLLPWVTDGCPSPEGKELKGWDKLGLGVSLLDPVLPPTAPHFAQSSQLRTELCGRYSQNGEPRARGPQIWEGGELGPGQADW